MRPRRRPGFTLIEVSIALVILGVVMTAAYSFFSFGTRAAGRTGARLGAVDTVSSALVQVGRRARYAHQILVPGVGQTSPLLEYRNQDTGSWTVSVVEGEGLVLQEKHGLTKKVLAAGVTGAEFQKDTMLEEDLLVVRFQVGQGPGAKRYETVLYTRGARRPPGT